VAAVRTILSTLSGLAQAVPGSAAARAGRHAAPQETRPGPSEGAWAHAGPEPLLEDLLSDPLIRQLMRADRVEPADLRRLVGRQRR